MSNDGSHSNYVDMYVVAEWECPACGERNTQSPPSPGDSDIYVDCWSCGKEFQATVRGGPDV